MNKIFLLALMGVMISAVTPNAQAEQVAGIAAVVNDEAISMADVKERMKLIMISSGLPNNEDIRAKILPQVVESLIEEQLKLQEASRNKLEVSDEEVEEGFATIAAQNKFTADQFRQIMKKSGISTQTLTRQIKAQLGWNKVIKEVLRNHVNVSESDVNTRIERMKAKIGQTEYLAAEIFLPTDAKQEAKVQQFAQRMASELQAKKAPFGAVAVQFSKAAGAEKGGTLGWVQQGQLPPELDTVLTSLEEGGVSNPIKTNDGIHILSLQKKRTITEESIPPRDELTNMIGFERLDRVQQRTLLDLKSAAFIDRRV
jgi:peptidyl-prolyl cis-trans isomerase SurA